MAFRSSAARLNRDVVLVSFARTPIGKFNGALSSLTATELGATAIKGAVERAGLTPEQIDEVIMGNVVSAGIGQAPARQASKFAGLPNSVVCTTVNKVCASGMKSAMMGAQSIALGQSDIVITGGMESMSNIPHYMPGARGGVRLGNASVIDGIVHDGLWDIYNNQHMGMCAEACAEKYNFSRDDQDAYCIESYTRAQNALSGGMFDDEIVSVEIKGRRGAESTFVTTDEEPTATKIEKIPGLRSAFMKEGTVTAANASSINDGAAAMVLMSANKAAELGITPIARIRGYADAEQDPVEFTTAPALAVPKALAHAGVSAGDVDFHEINEAFSVVALANMHLLDLDHSKVNVHGGAVAIGHPIGCSGARIMGSALTVLKKNDAGLATASICNGGGGASAIVLERI